MEPCSRFFVFCTFSLFFNLKKIIEARGATRKFLLLVRHDAVLQFVFFFSSTLTHLLHILLELLREHEHWGEFPAVHIMICIAKTAAPTLSFVEASPVIVMLLDWCFLFRLLMHFKFVENLQVHQHQSPGLPGRPLELYRRRKCLLDVDIAHRAP